MTQPTSLSAAVLQSLRSSGYRRPEVQYPDGDEVVDPGRKFRFMVPWPWHQLPADDLVGSTSLRSPAEVVVTAPRTDGRDPYLGLTTRTERFSLDAGSPRKEGRRHAKSSGVRWHATTRLIVDGGKALLTHGSPAGDDSTQTFLLLIPHDEILVTGRCDVPARSASGYGLHIGSMMATWQWAN